MPDVVLTTVRGIGPSTATVLTKHGFDTAGAIAAAPVERLVAIPGFGAARAEAVKAAAQQAMATADPAPTEKKAPSKKKSKDPKLGKSKKNKKAKKKSDGKQKKSKAKKKSKSKKKKK